MEPTTRYKRFTADQFTEAVAHCATEFRAGRGAVVTNGDKRFFFVPGIVMGLHPATILISLEGSGSILYETNRRLNAWQLVSKGFPIWAAEDLNNMINAIREVLQQGEPLAIADDNQEKQNGTH